MIVGHLARTLGTLTLGLALVACGSARDTLPAASLTSIEVPGGRTNPDLDASTAGPGADDDASQGDAVSPGDSTVGTDGVLTDGAGSNDAADGTEPSDATEPTDTIDEISDGNGSSDIADDIAADSTDADTAADSTDPPTDGGGPDATDLPCLIPSDCDDADPCTKDRCNFFSKTCSYEVIVDCPVIVDCQQDSDCNDGDPCSNDVCEGGVCFVEPGQCECQSDQDCDDDDVCTADSCTNLNTCKHAKIPSCKACSSLVATSFDNAAAINGWQTYSQTTENGWQVVTKRFVSPPSSLYMGNPAKWNYVNVDDNNPSTLLPTIEGIRIPGFTVPASGTTTVTFQVWLDIEDCVGASATQFDTFVLTVEDFPQNYNVVFDKCDVAQPWQGWRLVEADISQWAGFTIQGLWLYFDSGNEDYNETEGIFVDDLSIQNCPK